MTESKLTRNNPSFINFEDHDLLLPFTGNTYPWAKLEEMFHVSPRTKNGTTKKTFLPTVYHNKSSVNRCSLKGWKCTFPVWCRCKRKAFSGVHNVYFNRTACRSNMFNICQQSPSIGTNSKTPSPQHGTDVGFAANPNRPKSNIMPHTDWPAALS